MHTVIVMGGGCGMIGEGSSNIYASVVVIFETKEVNNRGNKVRNYS